jgi:gluconolactonase
MAHFDTGFLFLALALLAACSSPSEQSAATTGTGTRESPSEKTYPTTGSIETLDPDLAAVVRPEAEIEVLTEGFDWTEGPLWVPQLQKVLFVDIPPNKIHSWSEADGQQLYLTPSGYTGSTSRGGEVGANGLILDGEGRLILCQHGDRRLARMEAPLDNPQPTFTTLADTYEGKRLNSPNDVVMHSDGSFYFTDPPYGLEKNVDDPAKELDFQGVYRVRGPGQLQLLTKELSRPNGIAFSPDEKTLYVANSDPKKAIWMAYPVQDNGTIGPGKVFYDATSLVGQDKGLPDGLKVNRQGTIFATGPGGVWVFDPAGKVLGKIRTGEATSNCALSEDESTLYMTADNYLMRVRLR